MWVSFIFFFFFFFFFYLGFLSRTFSIHGTAGEGGGYLFNSSLPLPPASQALRHQPGDCCRQLTSAHSQQLDSNRELLVSERKSLTTKLRALCLINATFLKRLYFVNKTAMFQYFVSRRLCFCWVLIICCLTKFFLRLISLM